MISRPFFLLSYFILFRTTSYNLGDTRDFSEASLLCGLWSCAKVHGGSANKMHVGCSLEGATGSSFTGNRVNKKINRWLQPTRTEINNVRVV